MENTTQADVIDMKKVEEFVTKEDLEKQLNLLINLINK